MNSNKTYHHDLVVSVLQVWAMGGIAAGGMGDMRASIVTFLSAAMA